MKFSKLLIACSMFFGIAAISLPAKADPCAGVVGFSGTFSACNLVFTVNPNGSITSSALTGPFLLFGGDDVLIGVVNNSSSTLAGLWVTSTATSFAFDVPPDGISTTNVSVNGTKPGNPDTTGYGGPHAHFTNVAANFMSGFVSFVDNGSNGGGCVATLAYDCTGIGAGQTDYFSLEHSTGVLTAVVPEPETYALMLAGLGLMGFVSRRRKNLQA